MKKSGVDFRLNTEVAEIKSIISGLSVTTSSGEIIEVDKVLMATGRVPNTEDLQLNKAEVELDKKGAVLVGPDSKTTTPHIYAIGDCTDRINLTPVAIYEGRCLAETIYNDNYQIPDYRNIPTAIFTQPEVGTVGMSEEEAKSNGSSIDIYKTRFRPLKHNLTGRTETIFMKLVVDSLTDQVIGGHMVGAGAGELSQLLGVAIKVGATKEQFDQTVAVHPTASEEFVTMYETAS
jgi:glutathione reductase (NADPH)